MVISRKWPILLLVFFFLVVLLVGGGLLYLRTRAAGEQVRALVQGAITRELNIPVHLEPFSLTLGLRSINVRDLRVSVLSTRTPLLEVGRLRVVPALVPLLRGQLRIRAVVLEGPRLFVEDTPEIRSIVTSLASGAGAIAGDRTGAGFPILVEQGRITYRNPDAVTTVTLNGVRGSLSSPSPGLSVVEVTADEVQASVRDQRVGGIRLEGQSRIVGGYVEVERLTLTTGTTSLTVSGKLFGQEHPDAFVGDLTVTHGPRRALGEIKAGVRNGLFTVEHLLLNHGTSHLALSAEARLTRGASGSGQRPEKLPLSVSIDFKGRLEDLVGWADAQWPVAAPMVLQARLEGSPAGLKGVGHLEMRELRVGPERLEGLRAALAFSDGRFKIQPLTARRGNVSLRAEGEIDVAGRYRFAILPLTLDLAALSPVAATGGGGTITFRLWGTGRWPERRVEGELTIRNVVLRNVELGDGRAHLTLDGDQWRWDLGMAEGLSLRGTAPLLFNGLLQAEVTGRDADVAPFIGKLRARLPSPVTARADARGSIRGTLPKLEDLAGRIELSPLKGQVGPVPWRAPEPARLVVEGRAVRFESLNLFGPGLSVAVSGTVRPGAHTNLVLSGHAPFAIVERWVPALVDLRGTPNVQLSLLGPPTAIRVSGHADLAGLDAKPKVIPLWISVSGGEASFTNERVQYKIVQGTAAAGRLEGQGMARREGRRWVQSLDFTLDNARTEKIYEQLGREPKRLSGDLSSRGSFTFETGPGQDPIPTLQGKLSIGVQDGSLSRYPAMIRVFGLITTPAQPHRLPDLTREEMPVRRISADFTVTDGVMETRNLLLESEVVVVSGVGKVRLGERSVDFQLAVRPLQVLERGIRSIPLVGLPLAKDQGLVVTYFDVKGPWTDPAVSVAPLKSLGETVVDTLLLPLRLPARLIKPER